MPASSLRVRVARREDAQHLLRLVVALARYERLKPPGTAARRRLVRDLFGPRRQGPPMRVLLATQDGQPVGYAILLTTYSSFLARPTQWIEDLFVLPEARRAGVGRALLGAIARLARRRGCHRIEGVVLAWNRPAHRFYARTGGHVLRDWFLLRYDRPGLERAARV